MRPDGKIAGLRAHPAPCEGRLAEMHRGIHRARSRRPPWSIRWLLAGALLAGWAVGSIASQAVDADRAPSVILISLDGTRPVDITPEATPRLAALAEEGVVASRMIGVVPTNTFPSHVSLVTGVAPERHGVVNNVFIDPQRGPFDKKDIPSWIDVEPIWSLLERAGIPTAAYYWVGSEGDWPGGRGPRDWKRFSSRTAEARKVDQILEWMDRPAGEQPRLITSWFHGADHAAHVDGPGSDEAIHSLREQDAQIGRLIDGLKKRGRFADTTLIFVSDHGMAKASRRVDLGRELKRHADVSARVSGIGGFATVTLRDADRGDRDVIDRIVAGARRLGLEAWPRDEAPESWRVDNPRFGDVVVRAPIGTAIVHRGLSLEGFHGYDAGAAEMASLFIAVGRGAGPGIVLPSVGMLDVAPTVLALLGRPIPDWMEGEPIAPPASAVATGDPDSSPPPPTRSRPEDPR